MPMPLSPSPLHLKYWNGLKAVKVLHNNKPLTMIYKKDLKEYGYTNMWQYFSYIKDSLVNGQRKQARGLFESLSMGQKKDCMDYFLRNRFYPELKELISWL